MPRGDEHRPLAALDVQRELDGLAVALGRSVQVDQLVELVVAEVLQTGSICLARPDDSISEPSVLRRVDGSGVYTVAGSELYTSARILAAEQRLVRTAGRTDGRVLNGDTVQLALLESAANGDSLDAGQTALVRAMCTSGGAAAARNCPGWCREDHRHAHPGSGVERQRRPGNRIGPVGRRSCAAPRRNPATRPRAWPSRPARM